ncbi:DNA/RNA non-specific endonuclease [Sagittula stellata]|uniref:Probable protease n=1 Tax=Sagittula stellata (strain ATCC 700073 / DSM 11524 / E-37) TaxID=388399 RepID=A3JWZ9_SAGS3|nr:DNA/RNA non-specific endonuclease [Sagittula stellata]EBA10035.1 probable protease [Sagittula stellata E-37]
MAQSPKRVARDSLQRLTAFNRQIVASDPELAEEALDVTVGLTGTRGAADLDGIFLKESIILRRNRPVLDVRENAAVLEFASEAESDVWKARLSAAAEALDPVIRAVGRINLHNAPLSWVGTGWLVAEHIVVTNRHVAQEFAQAGGDGFTFTQSGGRPIRADVDFLSEFDNPDTRVFRLTQVLDITPAPGPDIAFFRVERASGDHRLAMPVPLAEEAALTNNAAVIGYPAFDSRTPDFTLMEDIFGARYNHKRLAPGAVTFLEDSRLYHDCTTLGGNSGSAVIDLDSGLALGLHYSGAFMRTNYAVRSDVVAKALRQVTTGIRPVRPAPSAAPPEAPRTSVTTTIPLTITVTLGDPAPAVSVQTRPVAPFIQSDDDLLDNTEAPAESYRDRRGFRPDFIGDGGLLCPLPQLIDETDLLRFDFDGQDETVLKYQHFSVAMNAARRLCLWSAVNINGAEPKAARRVGWKYDGRIEKRFQIKKECYGNPPKFSRGHMTRRNDPGWGNAAEARLGNEDSMHVTNATPQMQSFNAPIWLELEDHALRNAIDDDMRICVYTGPVLKDDDPVFFGVQVPVAFWKIIAFVHERTGHLSATGYRMDQTANLPRQDEFVFGVFQSSHTNEAAQVSIRSIEAETGLHFGGLAEIDPLGQQESLGTGPVTVPLLTGTQIRWF